MSLMLLALAGCKKSMEAGVASVWFTGTEEVPEVSIYVDGPTTSAFSITSSTVAKEDFTVEVAVDPSAVELYNQKNGTSYQMLPQSSFELSANKTTIASHKCVSNPISLSVTTMDEMEEGVTYIVPLKISNVSNGQKVLRASEYMYMVLKGVIHTTGSFFNFNGCYHVPSMMNNSSLSDLSACTIEIRVKMVDYATRNPFISTLIGVEEKFLLRFGDISCDPDQLQLAGRGVSITSKTHFTPGRWYHIAVVDDRNTARLYVDGELDTEVSSSGKAAIDLANTWQDGFWIGDSCGNRKMHGTVSEARVWERALSAVELSNNQCVIVDPVAAAANDKLIAYWRLDENNGGTDLTGHGFEAVKIGTVQIVDGVDCPYLE